MNQAQIIEYHESNLLKCINSHKAVSDYTTYAFFQFHGARNGMSVKELNEYARAESDNLHEQALIQIDKDMVETVNDAYDEVFNYEDAIKKHEANFLVCISQDKAHSEKTSLAFFKMQGAKQCMKTNDIDGYAEAQLSRLKAIRNKAGKTDA